MRFTATEIEGAWIVDLEERTDDRGFFARAFCREEFAAHGLDFDVQQANISRSERAGTLRGLHFQYPPAGETKFVRCISGAIHDVAVDLRAGSPTFGRHVGTELSATNHRALIVPAGCAHGFMSLLDGTEAMYLVNQKYTPAEEGGLRYDDPDLGIVWPMAATTLSDKDLSWASFDEQRASISLRMNVS
jgi:dTDP-4-dehydrorhamnose 3,5-epimerase